MTQSFNDRLHEFEVSLAVRALRTLDDGSRSGAQSSPACLSGLRPSATSRREQALDMGVSELGESRSWRRLSTRSRPPRVIIVKCASWEPRLKFQRRTLPAAAVLLLTLAMTCQRVSAASVSSDRAMASHESACKCGMKCGTQLVLLRRSQAGNATTGSPRRSARREPVP